MREINSPKCLHLKNGQVSNGNLSFYVKKLEKEEQNKLKESRKKGVIQLRIETNETEIRKSAGKSMLQKMGL